MEYKVINEVKMSEPSICEFLRQWTIIGNAVLAILQIAITAIGEFTRKEEK